MTDPRDEHETYGHTHSPVIEDLRKQIAALLDEQAGFRVAIAQLTAERDEARRDAERWQADALRLLNERKAAQEERDALRSIANKALRERDEARREVCRWAAARHRSEFRHYSTVNAIDYAEKRGWRDAWREGKE